MIDALLTENLPPSLLKLDRSLKGIWKGKNKLTQAGSKEEEKSFLQTQKERIRAMEEREERDHVLMMQEGMGYGSQSLEYNDDYDDQVGGWVGVYLCMIDTHLSTTYNLSYAPYYTYQSINQPLTHSLIHSLNQSIISSTNDAYDNHG